MPSRVYSRGGRQANADKTRAKLVTAARQLLVAKNGLTDFSLEEVAQQAGVTRLTIYNQFGSKTGLLEGVYDELARRGKIVGCLEAAFQHADAEECLNAVVEAFVQFWNAERTSIRYLRSMAVLNPDFKGLTQRDMRRRATLQLVLRRLADQRGKTSTDLDEKTEVLMMLTSFEAFDILAGPEPSIPKIVAQLNVLVHAALEIE